jgi:transcriptional regulator with XRE-family HTH domain
MSEHTVNKTHNTTPAVEDIPALLVQARAARDLTLAQVSEQTGLTVSTLSRIENGIYKPRAETFMKLVQWLEVSPQITRTNTAHPDTPHPDTMTVIADVLRRDPRLTAAAAKQLLRAWRPMYELYCQHDAEKPE